MKTSSKVWLCVASVSLVIGGTFAPLISYRYLYSAQHVMTQFQRYSGPESSQCDVLLAAGPRMATSLNEAALDRNFPKRRYAIYALGALGDEASLAVLTRLAQDSREDSLVRADSLLAIEQLSKSRARECARGLQAELDPNIQSATAKILSGQPLTDLELHRSVWDLLSSLL